MHFETTYQVLSQILDYDVHRSILLEYDKENPWNSQNTAYHIQKVTVHIYQKLCSD